METVKIDPEFKSLIPSLSAVELSGLRSSIIAEGCRDALVVWGGILLDGHHRYAICTELGLPFKVKSLEFEDRDAAKIWMAGNQLHRRNLTPDQASYFRGMMYTLTKKTQGAPAGNDNAGKQRSQTATVVLDTATTIAKKAGVHRATVLRDAKKYEAVEKLAETKPEVAQAVRDGTKRFNEVRREAKLEQVKEAVKLPDSKYRVLYADPPWKYGDQLTEDYGAVKFHYPSMTIAELCALPVETLCEADAVLFLWVTSPLLYEAAPIIEAWGFEYKTSFVWDKVKHNMGHYNSVRHEFLLICTRGSCTPDSRKLVDSVQSIERTKHSAKPPEFRRIIEAMYPHGKRLELFAREENKGWDVWGNQVKP